MKVRQVEPIVLEAPVKKPWRVGTAVYTSMHAALVRVEMDEGITGFGEGLARFSLRAAALPNFLIFEHRYPPNPLREELLVEPLPPMENGHVAVPHGPGLGIEIDEGALARFRVG